MYRKSNIFAVEGTIYSVSYGSNNYTGQVKRRKVFIKYGTYAPDGIGKMVYKNGDIYVLKDNEMDRKFIRKDDWRKRQIDKIIS